MHLTDLMLAEVDRQAVLTRRTLERVPEDTPIGGRTEVDADGLPRDRNVAKGRAALEGTSDEHLLTTSWQLLVCGKVVYEQPRHICSTTSHITAASSPSTCA